MSIEDIRQINEKLIRKHLDNLILDVDTAHAGIINSYTLEGRKENYVSLLVNMIDSYKPPEKEVTSEPKPNCKDMQRAIRTLIHFEDSCYNHTCAICKDMSYADWVKRIIDVALHIDIR